MKPTGLIVALAALILPIQADPPATEGQRVSLLIGIADYAHFSEHGPPGQTTLRGPVNDVSRMRQSLRRWGFEAGAAQRVLLDEQATRQGILDGLEWLAGMVTDSADAVVVYFSGHGSVAPDMDIDDIRRRDEYLVTPGDTLDEALVPWDARNIHDPHQLVLDDEIGYWLDRIGTSNVTVIIDACFSGTITRGDPESPAAGEPRARGPRVNAAGGAAFDVGLSMGHTLLTAASASELAYEQPFETGVVHGAFTYHLTRWLDAAPDDARFDDLVQDLTVQLRRGSRPQTPQLEGDRAARLFRVHETPVAQAYAVATARADGRVDLDIGAAHGVRTGTLFDVHPPDAATFTAAPLLQVRATEVAQATAIAEPVSAGGDVPQSARLVPAAMPVGVTVLERLPVHVHAEVRSTAAGLSGLDWVEEVGPDSALVEIRAAGDGIEIRALGEVITPLEGERTATGRSYAHPADAQLCEPLNRAFAIAALSRIRNPAPPSPSRLDVQIRIAPEGVDPDRTTAGVDTAWVGERYTIWGRVAVPPARASTDRVYFSAAVGGYISAAFALYPAGGAMPAFPLNQWVALTEPIRMSPVTGMESITAVAGTDAYDLRSLMDRLPGCARSVGTQTRDLGWLGRLSGWTATERRLLVLPKP